MSVNFKVPASPQKSIVTISDFLGVDFTNSPANVDEQKSPNSENMIRDVPGRFASGWAIGLLKSMMENQWCIICSEGAENR